MKIYELDDEKLEIIGTGKEVVKYCKNMLYEAVVGDDIDAMRRIDMGEFVDLFERTEEDKLYRVILSENSIVGTIDIDFNVIVKKGGE